MSSSSPPRHPLPPTVSSRTDEPKRLLPRLETSQQASHATLDLPPEAQLLTIEQAASVLQVSAYYLRRAVGERGLLSIQLPTVGSEGSAGPRRSRPMIRIALADLESWFNKFRCDVRREAPREDRHLGRRDAPQGARRDGQHGPRSGGAR